jgi:hypothetical protein
MATTTNFGWETPDDTDLVKDGAAAIRTALGGVDTSFVDLKGGTTGQVLAKASATDLDFTWATDASGIPATIFDAKGDIIAASAADTAARLAVGANDTVLMADSTAATGLKWGTPPAGGMTLISSVSLTGTTVSIGSIPTTYKHLLLNINGWNSSNSAVVRLNGVSSASYYNQENGSGTTEVFPAGNLGTSPNSNYNTISSWIYNYTTTASFKQVLSTSTSVNSGGGYASKNVSGVLASTTAAINAVSFVSTGGFSSGTMTLWGVS